MNYFISASFGIITVLYVCMVVKSCHINMSGCLYIS